MVTKLILEINKITR